MDIVDRISNIKKLLCYCDNEVAEIIDETVGEFFYKLIKSRPEFKEPAVCPSFPIIGLATHILNRENKFGLFFEYCYDFDRDGEDWTSCYFNDPGVTYEYDFLKPKDGLEYSDIPDYIWKIIQDEICRMVTKKVDEDIENELEILGKCLEKKEKFVKRLGLK